MSVADLSVADLRPEIDVEVEITPVGRTLSVSARVEDAGPADVVVRPGVSGFVDEAVVAVGERVSVLWLSSEGARALPADVATVERGAVPRWHLKVVGPAEAIQRRQAVRARVALPVVAVVNGIDLEGDIVDISEGGVRAVVEPYGVTPIAGSTLSLTVQLEEGPITAPAEVVRQQTVDARWALSLRFTDLPEKEQDRLRRRVFRAIREERARHSE
ncbi:flagellar brake protein [Geodermatophilus sp. DSM 45219]|uniref:flagellar brake protein n=1 Tax=Geodermatophilus sp. DSM 45219 TaxID=1881103 RepID=UPI0008825345|nr:PilZ domain-containing protein [Geodermatophilus sp. DSM 45219]SDO05864.1 PilZ domain-containing protein [Geodermatophilus sp. DSM 45219]